MKKCNKCNVELVVEINFNKSDYKSSYYICKKCKNAKVRAKYKANPNSAKLAKEYRLKNPNINKRAVKKYHKKFDIDGHVVYYLPQYHYVGVTKNLYERFKTHKYQQNRWLVDDFEIIYKTPCRKEALKVESKLHSIGYYG